MSRVVKGLHSWQHVCGHPLWEGSFWGQEVFLWGPESCLICQLRCKLRCKIFAKEKMGWEPSKGKRSLSFYVDRVWIRPAVLGQFGVWSSVTRKGTEKPSVSPVRSKGTYLKHTDVWCIWREVLWATVAKNTKKNQLNLRKVTFRTRKTGVQNDYSFLDLFPSPGEHSTAADNAVVCRTWRDQLHYLLFPKAPSTSPCKLQLTFMAFILQNHVEVWEPLWFVCCFMLRELDQYSTTIFLWCKYVKFLHPCFY